jgi:hypothetical protein
LGIEAAVTRVCGPAAPAKAKTRELEWRIQAMRSTVTLLSAISAILVVDAYAMFDEFLKRKDYWRRDAASQGPGAFRHDRDP